MCARLIVVALLSTALLSGCDSSENTPAPPGLEALEESTAPEPTAQAGDPYPEMLSTVHGTGQGDSVFGHGRGFVHAPILAVFEAMKNPDTLVDRRQIDEWRVTWNVEPGYDVSFRTHNTVRNFITIEFEMTFRVGVVEGTAEAPLRIIEVARKTSGSSYVELAQHSIVVTKVNDSTTKLEVVVQGKGATVGPSDMAVSARDLFNSIVARVHGRPLPDV
ncbi:hypothetical protein MYSTI_04788 [Myxococcus stipitatus DSM 14675]|uniref:Lipoprotein n=1 Tax=Myxococcus stipitatus (strain DSM 14675 / JCM 12634 / Mx s8) TaxID=1278073 RepID=L7UDE6_MYXSD|nr:hypothetical protein [Myxococcus stipitatus]AGC46078.1 hypothetical protein MYSTI_04788 [Myxococcus stipitatus DSM 14675]